MKKRAVTPPEQKTGRSDRTTDHPHGTDEVLCGFHSVHEALKAGKREFAELMVQKDKMGHRHEQVASLAQSRKIPVRPVGVELLDRLAQGARHQGVILKSKGIPLVPASRAMAQFGKDSTPCFILILENIEDPHNLGALIRTAQCAGVSSIFIPKDRSCHPTPSVSRSSAGAMEHADIFVMTNTASFIKEIKQHGFWVGGLDAAGENPLHQTDMTGRFALVVGSEHKGIRPLVRKQCDYLISIPMLGKVNSLNASVAGAVAMYEGLRQREITTPGAQ